MPLPPSRADEMAMLSASGRGRGACQLLAITMLMAILWLGVWPALSQQPKIRAAIERNRELGINPSAKFYSEHDATSNALMSVDSARRRDSAAWWQPRFKNPWASITGDRR